MDAIFTAVIGVLAVAVLVALLWSNRKQEKENCLTEGMCLGIVLGAGLRSLLNMDLGVAISIGMLLGALIGQQVPKKRETNPGSEGQTTAQNEQAGALGQEDDYEKH
ncbi:MAG: hypothetical protein ACOYJZ_07775 [Acutalibacter sp.]|jgi:hypothetical protein